MGQIIASELMYFAYYFLFYDLNTVYFLSIISHYMQSPALFCQVTSKFLTKLRPSELLCLSLCCSLCLECSSHLHLSNSSTFSRTPFEYHLLGQALPELSIIHPPLYFLRAVIAPWSLPYLLCSITLFCLLSSCTTLWLWKQCLLFWCYFYFSTPHQIYTEYRFNEQLWLEKVNTFICHAYQCFVTSLTPTSLLPNRLSLHSAVCRLWRASSMVFVIIAKAHDLAEMTARKMHVHIESCCPCLLEHRMRLKFYTFSREMSE